MALLRHLNNRQNGQILVIVMIIMALCGLTMVPLLNYMGTGLSAVQTYQENTDLLYAADAGIQKGVWYGKNNLSESMRLETYSENLPVFTVNGNTVEVELGYCWILEGIVDPVYGPHQEIVVNTRGEGDENGVYTLCIVYTAFGNKKIDTMGVWLPTGFDYVAGSCALEEFNNASHTNNTTAEPEKVYTYGGVSLKWDVTNVSFSSLGEAPTQKFKFTTVGTVPEGTVPMGDIAWLRSQSNDVGLSWECEIWNFAMTSKATSPTGKSVTVTAHVFLDTRTTGGVKIIDYAVN